MSKLGRLAFLFVLGVLVVAQPLAPSYAALHGQVIVDPTNPRWFVYNRDANLDGRLDPFYWAGPGGPEDFLYRGIRNADGTRAGDQSAIIQSLGQSRANALYMHIVRSHGGDGDSTHNPFVSNDPNRGLNQAVINQWSSWIADMEAFGIVPLLFFYDDSADPFGTNTLSLAEQTFIQGVVNALEEHPNLIWGIAEEYDEAFASFPHRVSAIAAAIRAADDYAHPITLHHSQGDNTMDFPDDPNIDQFAQQSPATSADALFTDVNAAYDHANGRFNVNMAENWNNGFSDHTTALRSNNRMDARRRNWAVGMAGGYVMVVGTWETIGVPPPAEWLADWGRQRTFFESTRFNEMTPSNALKFGGTQYVLAEPGQRYIAYASSASGSLGLLDMTAGVYSFTWLDIATGTVVTQTNVQVAAGNQSWARPAGIGTETAVYLQRIADLSATATRTPSPSATHTSTHTPTETTPPAVTPSLMPTATSTLTSIPTATIPTTATPSLIPTATPAAVSTQLSGHYPRVLLSTHPQIRFTEVRPPMSNRAALQAEVLASQGVLQAIWMVNGRWVNTESAAPFFLGGDRSGTPNGYLVTASPINISLTIQFSNGVYIEGRTTYSLTAAQPVILPTNQVSATLMPLEEVLIPTAQSSLPPVSLEPPQEGAAGEG